MEPESIWKEQCDAARNLKMHFGIEKAMGYLVGEKLLRFLEVASMLVAFEWARELLLDTDK